MTTDNSNSDQCIPSKIIYETTYDINWQCPYCNIDSAGQHETVCPCQNHYEITYGNTDNSSLGV